MIARRFIARASRIARMFQTRYAHDVTVFVTLDDDTEQELRVKSGTTLLSAIDASDFSDVWEGGACGGACACSTCRVIVDKEWMSKLPEAEDDELDILDDGAAQAGAVAGGAERGPAAAAFLSRARLSCQIELEEQLDGLRVAIPETLFNMLEIPLHMRSR